MVAARTASIIADGTVLIITWAKTWRMKSDQAWTVGLASTVMAVILKDGMGNHELSLYVLQMLSVRTF